MRTAPPWAVLGAVIVAFFGLIGVIARQRPEMRKLAHDRITALENRIDKQDRDHKREIRFERALHAAELAMMRHQRNNLRQVLISLLTIMEKSGEFGDYVSTLRTQLSDYEKQEQDEASRIHEARLKAVAEGAEE